MWARPKLGKQNTKYFLINSSPDSTVVERMEELEEIDGGGVDHDLHKTQLQIWLWRMVSPRK